MVPTHVFTYLLFLLAPLVTYLSSKIRLFAPQSKYVAEHDATPAPADLIFSTRYLEMYAPHTLAVAVLISVSLLSILHLGYFIYVTRQPPIPVKLPWKTELEAYTDPKDKQAITRGMSTWRGVKGVIQSQLPELNVYRPSLTRSATVASDTPAPEDIELKELKMPPSAHVRDTTPLVPRRASYDLLHGTEEGEADWETVYCDGWADGLDWDGITGLESWSPN